MSLEFMVQVFSSDAPLHTNFMIFSLNGIFLFLEEFLHSFPRYFDSSELESQIVFELQLENPGDVLLVDLLEFTLHVNQGDLFEKKHSLQEKIPEHFGIHQFFLAERDFDLVERILVFVYVEPGVMGCQLGNKIHHWID